MKTILLVGSCICTIGAAQAGLFDGISKATSSVTGMLSDSGSAAQIKKSDIKYDGTVRLVSKTYGNVAVMPDDLKPGDFIRNNNGWLEATKQWEERRAAEQELVAKAEAEKLEAEREARVQAEIQRATKEDGMVKLCSYGGRGYDGSILGRGPDVMVLASELQSGDVAIVESGAYFGRLTTTKQWEDRCRSEYDVRQEELRKAEEEKQAVERKAREKERDEKLIRQLCDKCDVDYVDVSENDVEVSRWGTEYIAEWTDRGRGRMEEFRKKRRARKVAEAGIAGELKAHIAAKADKVEQKLTPLLSTINESGVWSVDWELYDKIIDKDFKHHNLVFSYENQFYTLEGGGEKIKKNLSNLFAITNICEEVNHKTIGPFFSIRETDGKKRLTFEKEIYCNVLDNIIADHIEKFQNGELKEDDWDRFIRYFPNTSYVISAREEEFSVADTSCRVSGDGIDLPKFATQYTMALDIIAKEEARIAEKERLAKEYMNMTEEEKFPLLSVQPKPQILMKGVSSGASVKWVEGWLIANKAEPRGVKEATFRDGLLYYNLTGMALKDARQDMIFATFNEQGKPTRNAIFYFNDGVLVGVNIVIEGSIPSVDQLIEKYSSELGGSVKVERGNKKDVRGFAYNAKTPDEIDYFNQVRWFVQDCFANVANSDVNVRIDYKVFAGLIALSQDTLAMLNMLGVEEQVRYLEFGKDGKADLIVSADGSVLRCTSEGKTLKGWVAGASKLENCKRKVENVSDKVIKVEDKKLKAHFDAIERSKAEAARKAAEEAKKKADAAALDF